MALPEGQLVVNSSQGGGSKDTWVLDRRPVLSEAANDEAALAASPLLSAAGQVEDPHTPFMSSPQDEDVEARHQQQQQQQQEKEMPC